MSWKMLGQSFPKPFHFASILSNTFILHLLQYCNATLGVTGFTKHFNIANGVAA
jgi:hypothetical protein